MGSCPLCTNFRTGVLSGDGNVGALCVFSYKLLTMCLFVTGSVRFFAQVKLAERVGFESLGLRTCPPDMPALRPVLIPLAISKKPIPLGIGLVFCLWRREWDSLRRCVSVVRPHYCDYHAGTYDNAPRALSLHGPFSSHSRHIRRKPTPAYRDRLICVIWRREWDSSPWVYEHVPRTCPLHDPFSSHSP